MQDNIEEKKTEESPEKKKRSEAVRALKFTLFSLSAGLVEILSYTALEFAGLPAWLCHLISLVLSVIWNFTLNRRFTFRSVNNVPKAMLLVALFYAFFTPASTWMVKYLTETARWNDFLAKLLSMLSNFILEFLYDKYVVFRGSIDSRDNVKKEKESDVK